MKYHIFLVLVFNSCALSAQLHLPAIFGDHMVLQQKQSNPVWGWASPGEQINVGINGQSHTVVADQKGYWKISLKPIPVGGPYKMTIEGANTKFFFEDVLVGEVWLCSGQSNMEWPVKNTNSAEITTLTARYPNIRLISVPRAGTIEILNDFKGEWTSCTPESVSEFSAVGYFFGRNLHHALDVPIGLIDNSRGGSAAEAWVNKKVMEKDTKYKDLMAWWKEKELSYNEDLKKWEQSVIEWENGPKDKPKPNSPTVLMTGVQRPANIYNSVLHPTIGYGIKGVIWYQGEANAGRAYQYRDLFPMMIDNWRQEWGQGNFPFYYVQLADFMAEVDEPEESAWAELREAQTLAMEKLPNLGQAVIIDLGEGRDIHPRSKQTVADRLSRWALAKDYQKNILFEGPVYQSMEIKGNKIVLTFKNVGQGLYAFDTQDPQGFAIAGSDRKFVWASAKIINANQIEISSEKIENPIAVRYAWANNPVCNMYSRDGLPMCPFRTDVWPGITWGKTNR